MIKNLKNLLNKIFRRGNHGGPPDPTTYVKNLWSSSTGNYGSIDQTATGNGVFNIRQQYTDGGTPATTFDSKITFNSKGSLCYDATSKSGADALLSTDVLALATVGYVNSGGGGGGGGSSFVLDPTITSETVYTPWSFTAVTEGTVYARIYRSASSGVSLTAGVNTIALGTLSGALSAILHNSGSYNLVNDGYTYTLNTMEGFVYYKNSNKTFYLQVTSEVVDTINYTVFLIYQR